MTSPFTKKDRIRPLTPDMALKMLKQIAESDKDVETCHYEADDILLGLIKNAYHPTVSGPILEAYNAIDKWYA